MCTLLEHVRYSGKANQPDISQTEESGTLQFAGLSLLLTYWELEAS